MHYRNGREAKNGDLVLQMSMDGSKVVAVGVLYDAVPGNDYCNGMIAPVQNPVQVACLADCLSLEDVSSLVAAAGLGRRQGRRQG